MNKVKKMRKVIKHVKKKVPRKQVEGQEQSKEPEFDEISVDTEVEETDPEVSGDDNDDDFYKDKLIAFEDEKFQEEKGETILPFDQFMPYFEDFINEHYDFVVIDSNGELEGLNDQKSDLNKSENPYQNAVDGVDDPLKANLVNTIGMYEQMIKADQFKTPEEKKTAEGLVKTLHKQLKDYEQRKTVNTMSKSKPPPTKKELRIKGLKEIFHFYAKQHIPRNLAFDQLEVVMNQIDLGEFTSFCKDFEIPLSRTHITRCFKQCSSNGKPLEFEHFYKGVLRLGAEMHTQQIEDLEKKLKSMPGAKNSDKNDDSDDNEGDSEDGSDDGSGSDSDGSKSKTTKKSKATKKSTKKSSKKATF